MKLAVTGANSSVGHSLLDCIGRQSDITAVAGVRSTQAAAALPAVDTVQSAIVSYQDVDGLAEVFAGADCVVHLAGVLFESPGSSYQHANVETTIAVVEAARKAQVGHLLLVSALGADTRSTNRYLKSKGEAEHAVRDCGLPSTIIRTPLLLGPGSAGAAALVSSAARKTAFLLKGGKHRVSPLDTDDLSTAIITACRRAPQGTATYELVGPEPIRYSELLKRSAAMLGKEIRIIAVPVCGAKLLAAISYRLRGYGISPDIIEVICADEAVADNADGDLGIALTPLPETLAKLIDISQ